MSGRMWAMGVSASNALGDLTEKAKAHAAAREGMIEAEARDLADRRQIPLDQAMAIMKDTVAAARRRMKIAGGEQMPNLTDHGVAAPVLIGGEFYGTEGVEYLSGGDRIATVHRAIGGGRFATRKIRMCVDGGERTRVVADVRGS